MPLRWWYISTTCRARVTALPRKLLQMVQPLHGAWKLQLGNRASYAKNDRVSGRNLP